MFVSILNYILIKMGPSSVLSHVLDNLNIAEPLKQRYQHRTDNCLMNKVYLYSLFYYFVLDIAMK